MAMLVDPNQLALLGALMHDASIWTSLLTGLAANFISDILRHLKDKTDRKAISIADLTADQKAVIASFFKNLLRRFTDDLNCLELNPEDLTLVQQWTVSSTVDLQIFTSIETKEYPDLIIEIGTNAIHYFISWCKKAHPELADERIESASRVAARVIQLSLKAMPESANQTLSQDFVCREVRALHPALNLVENGLRSVQSTVDRIESKFDGYQTDHECMLYLISKIKILEDKIDEVKSSGQAIENQLIEESLLSQKHRHMAELKSRRIADMLNNEGLRWEMQGNLQNAKHAFEASVKEYPTWYAAANLTQAYCILNHPKEANTFLEKTLAAAKRDTEKLPLRFAITRSFVHIASGELEKALVVLQEIGHEINEVHPLAVFYNLNLATLYDRMRRPSDALRIYNWMLGLPQLTPQEMQLVNFFIAVCYSNKKDKHMAELYLQEALRVSVRNQFLPIEVVDRFIRQEIPDYVPNLEKTIKQVKAEGK